MQFALKTEETPPITFGVRENTFNRIFICDHRLMYMEILGAPAEAIICKVRLHCINHRKCSLGWLPSGKQYVCTPIKCQTKAFVNFYAPCCTTSSVLNRPLHVSLELAASSVNHCHLGAQRASRSFSEMAPIVQGGVIVIMGVSGAGKTTIGNLLAEAAKCSFLDADDFHPDSNKEKMRKGIPLSEEDRMPWLELLCSALKERIIAGKTTVLACSALRKNYREILRSSDPNYIPGRQGSSVKFVLLNIPVEVLADRLNKRLTNREHFMPPSLLQSQLDLLEIDASEGILQVDATQKPTVIVETIRFACSNEEF